MSWPRKLAIAAVVLLALLLLLTGVFTLAYNRDLYVPQSGPAPDLVLRGGLLFDGTGDAPVPNSLLVVRAGRIACIGETCAVPDGAVTIDAGNRAILPGLIDLHGHFFGFRGAPGLAEIWSSLRLRPEFRRALLESGVTSYRSLGDPRDAVLALKQQLDGQELAGPRLFVVGPIFTAPGGHPTHAGRDPNPSGFGGNMAFQSDDPRQVADEVSRLAAQGVDGIKAVFQGRAGVSLQTLQALVRAAQAHGLWVAVHVGPDQESKTVVGLGVTTIEHGVRNGHLVDDETLKVLGGSAVVYVPTLGREPEGPLNIPALVKAGVTFGVGTDGEDYHAELARMVAAGMMPASVLLAATRHGAMGLKKLDMLGTLETGKLADIILVDGAPWRDIGALKSPRLVIQNGRIVLDRR